MPDILPEGGFSNTALAVDTYIKEEKGQWVVYLDVIFWEETVHRRIQAYRTRRQAEIAAVWIKRGAERDLRNPSFGI